MIARGAVSLLARGFAAGQWKGLALATVLLALGGTVTLAALAGARRTSSAAERALEHVEIADVSVDVASVEPERLDRLRSLPEVEDISVYGFTPVRPVGSNLVPGIDLVGVLPLDDRATIAMDRPRVLEGRLPHPARIDEAVVNPALADQLDVGVGDTIALETYSQGEINAVFESAEPPPPTGAKAVVRVVGIGLDLTEVVDPDAAGFGVLLLSHAWASGFGPEFTSVETYDGDVGLFRVLLRTRLHGGEDDVPGYLEEVFDVYAGSEASSLFSEARSELFGDAAATLRVEALALLLCGLAAGIATVVAAAQALARQQFLAAVPAVPVAVGVGLPRRDRRLALLVPSAGAIAVGILVALLAAAAASPVFPRGLGDRLEPDRGLRLDLVPLVGGAGCLAVFVTAACAIGAIRSSRVADAPTALVPRMRMPLGRPEIGVGLRMALHVGRGLTRVPTRQTVIGAVVGVAGVVAALTFAASLGHLVSTPRLYGDDYDTVVVLQGTAGEQAETAQAQLIADRRIEGLTRYGVSEVALGEDRMSADFYDVVKGAPGVALLRGRAPATPTELAVDPDAIPGDEPEVGATLRVGGPAGEVDMRVVGHLTGIHDALVMLGTAADQLGIDGYEASGFRVRWADGVDEATARASLEREFAEVYPVTPSESIANLARVSGFPYAVAVLLAVLAAAGVGHLLASGVRRRARDLAILKAFGFSRRRTRATVRWQAITVTVIAVVVGIVLGTVAGRGAWALVTSSLRVIFEPTVPPLGLLAVTVASFAVTLAVAAIPARLAARTPPAVVLRAE